MKASERMREIDATMTLGPWRDDSRLERYMDDAEVFPIVVRDDDNTHVAEMVNDNDTAGVAALRNALPAVADLVESVEKICFRRDCALGEALTKLERVLQCDT